MRRVVKDLGGVQAQLASAAVMQLGVRASGLKQEAIERALNDQRTLVKAWAMRGTIHWIDADDFPTWAAALSTRLHWTPARAKYWEKAFKLKLADIEPAVDAIVDVLDGRCLTRNQLADEIKSKVKNKSIDERLRSSWGEVLKIVSIRGLLCFGPNEGRNVTFTRADQWLKKWSRVDPQDALADVYRRYLASHGPATREEFARWWGIFPPAANDVIEATEKEWALVDREGDKAYVLKKDLPALQRSREDKTVRALGMFDAYTLAGLPHDQIVPKGKKNKVYRTGAWVSQVITVGGHVVGVWNYDTKAKGTKIEAKLFKARSVSKAAAEEALQPLLPYMGNVISINVA